MHDSNAAAEDIYKQSECETNIKRKGEIIIIIIIIIMTLTSNNERQILIKILSNDC